MSEHLAHIEDLNPEQHRELAVAYLDLMGLLLDALEQCQHGFAFVSVNEDGSGFLVSGHVPPDLVLLPLAVKVEQR